MITVVPRNDKDLREMIAKDWDRPVDEIIDAIYAYLTKYAMEILAQEAVPQNNDRHKRK